MTSPNRSVVVRLSMEPSSYIAGAARAGAATTALDREVAKVGGTAATSMEKAAQGAGSAETAMGRANKAAGALGFSLGGLAGVGTAVAAGLSVKWAGDYQSALTRLSTTAGESQKNLGMVGKGMLDMAGQVGVGADELAKGMYTVESSGIHGANALTVLKAAAQGARQENADLTKVTDAVTTALHDYNLPASDAARVTSQLVTAVSHGKTTFDELTGAMHSVTPLAAALHVPLSDIAGTLSAMTASGESADQAAQNMADALRHMQNPTATMTSELAQLGINSAELGPMLGQKGLAGTIQTISTAIVNHLDPATKQVLLPALNQSKTAAQDLQIMLGQMPPALAKMSRGLLDGSESLGDYKKAAGELGGTQGAMAMQFLALVKSSQGFSNILKSGQPAAQEYTAALQKAMGTSAGLTVALQVTGEHAEATNDAIKDIAKAAGDAKGNIKGWDEVQGNFNQQLAQSEAKAKSLAIEAGQHLLPVLTGGLGVINRDVIPGIEHLGSAVGVAAHWFSELPAPVKEAASVLGALALANKIGVFTTLASGASRFAAGLTSMVSGIGGATTSLSGLRSAGTRVMDMFGGPVVLGIAGVTAAVVSSIRQTDDWAKSLEQGGKAAWGATQQIQKQEQAGLGLNDWLDRAKGLWNDGVSQIQGYSSALDQAQRKAQAMHDALPPLQRSQQDVTTDTNNLADAIDKFGRNSGEAKYQAWLLGLAQDDLRGHEKNLDLSTRGVNGALSEQIGLQAQLSQAGLSLDQATLSTKQQIDQYRQSLKDTNVDEYTRQQNLDGVAQSMFGVLDAAKKKADAETQGLPVAVTTNQEIVRQRDALDDVVNKLGFVPPALKEMYDQLNGPTAQALQAAQTNVNQTGTAMTTLSNDTIRGTVLPALDDFAKAAGVTVPQAVTGGFLQIGKGVQEGTGITNTAVQGTTGQLDGFMRQLLGFPSIVDGPFASSMQGASGHMAGAGGQADTTSGQVDSLGRVIGALPPSHNTVITANTDQAQTSIDAFLKKVQAQGFVGAMFNLQPVGSGGQTGGLIGMPALKKAAGGPIVGPGTGTSDSVLIAGSNGEHMWTAAEVSAAGGHGAVESLRQAVLAGGFGFAGGGPITTSPWQGSYPVDFNQSMKDGWAASLAKAAAAFAPGAPTSVSANAALAKTMVSTLGWTGAEWDALYALGMRESGWRNTAQNPTSTAYGIPQFLNSTWATVGMTKTSDPGSQIIGMERYIQQRYGDPIKAWAHETKFGWYHDGGTVRGPDGATVPAFLKVGETVRTAEQEASVRQVVRSHESGGGGRAAALGPITVIAQFGTEEIEARTVRVVVGALDALHDRGQY